MVVKYMIPNLTTILDKGSGNLSIINIISGVSAVAFPIAMNQMHVACLLESSDNLVKEFKVILKLNDNILASQNVAVDFSNSLKANHILQFQGLILQEPGILKISIEIGNIELSFTEIEITIIQPA
jgi:ribosomal protein S6